MADTFNDRICIINLTDGAFKFFGSSRQPRPGKLLRAAGLAKIGKEIFVTDIFNSLIQVFDEDGNFIRSFGGFGEGPGKLKYPNQVFADGGKIYVADSFNRRIAVFNPEGSWDGEIGKDLFGNVMYMNRDSRGNLLAGDWEKGVFVFDRENKHIRTLAVPQASGIGVDPIDGTLYVCSAADSVIYIFDRDYNQTGVFGAPGKGDKGDFFFAPLDVEVTEDAIYVADYRNNRVAVFDKSRRILASFGGFGHGKNNLIYPDAVICDGDTLYVAEWCNDRVHKLRVRGKAKK